MGRRERVVRAFAIVLLFGLFLVVFQYFKFGGINAFVFNDLDTQQSTLYENNEFNVSLIGFNLYDGRITLEYKIKEMSGKNQIIDLNYELYGDRLIKEGNEKIVLEKDSEDSRYLLTFYLPDDFMGKGNLFLEFDNGYRKHLIEKEIYVSRNRLTGAVISDREIQNISFFFVGLFILLVLLFILKTFIYRRNLNKIRKVTGKRLIKLDV